ncbi:MAG: nucleotide exchange factor GrpE [Saprospiraceae bacterium]|nr:nucleotide exchange factor GrpE [Saprospiraceae bacterium]
MRKTLKKLRAMVEKDTIASEQDVVEEQEKPTDEQAENSAENEKIRELQTQLEESRNKFLYLFSDFENFKRHAAKERMDLIQTAGRDILASLLPILDDFDRADKNDALTEGTTLIHQKLVKTLKSKGLTAVETKPGDEFNADLHEAVAEIPAATDDLKGKIVDILEPGYSLGERIIRFAKVVVGK